MLHICIVKTQYIILNNASFIPMVDFSFFCFITLLTRGSPVNMQKSVLGQVISYLRVGFFFFFFGWLHWEELIIGVLL